MSLSLLVSRLPLVLWALLSQPVPFYLYTDRGSVIVKEGVEDDSMEEGGDGFRPEGRGLVEKVEAEVEEFMAVKPWIGQLFAPSGREEEGKGEPPGPPNATITLEHVYGYRAHDTRMNAFYNVEGKVRSSQALPPLSCAQIFSIPELGVAYR